MILLQILSFCLFVAGAAFLLKLSPERIANDVIRIFSPNRSLRDDIYITQKKKKKKSFSETIVKMKEALEDAGKKTLFSTMCAASVLLMVGGCIVAVIINNFYMIPTLCLVLASLPYFYAKSVLSAHEKHTKDELETTLSIITTSYIRTDDIISAVRENIQYFKPPMDAIFKEFVVEATVIRSDTKTALRNLQNKIESEVFDEWCEALIACQDDRTLKDTLLAIVAKLTDIRIVNNDLKTIIGSARTEYWAMAGLTVAVYPLLYVVNKDWFAVLVDTDIGKIITAIVFSIIMVFTVLMFKYTKPIEYKK